MKTLRKCVCWVGFSLVVEIHTFCDSNNSFDLTECYHSLFCAHIFTI